MENKEISWTAKLLRDLRALEGRDVHLWSLGIMVLIVVTAGFAALVVPNLMWGEQNLRVNARSSLNCSMGSSPLSCSLISMLSTKRENSATPATNWCASW